MQQQPTKKYKEKIRPRNIVYQIILLLITCVYLYPLYIVVVISLKLPKDLLFNMTSFPTEFHFENYAEAWRRLQFGTKFFNSLIVTMVSVLGIAIIAGMASFTMAKCKNRIYVIVYYFFIAGLMVPFYMTLTPLMKLMRDLSLFNSRLGLALVYIGRSLPFSVLLFVSFIRGVPGEIMESAYMDGCTPFQCYFRIVMPITQTVTSTVIILNVLTVWNDFLLPMLTLTESKKQTIPIVLRTFYGESGNQWNLTFASFMLSILPLLVFYFIFQDRIVEGVAAGAVKG